VVVTLLGDRFFIVQLNKKVSQFVRGCLIYKHVKGPRQIQRPYGPTFTATTRNEALHWDFIYLGEGFGDAAYVLVVKDSLTHFCELFPCSTPTAYVAARFINYYGGLATKNSIMVQNPHEKLELKVKTQGKTKTASKSKIMKRIATK
jgi:hypothetical protein